MTDLGSANQFGLLAYGSTPLWEVAVDESLTSGNEWRMQLQSRHLDLDFQLNELDAIAQTIGMLNRGLKRFSKQPTEPITDSLVLGKFGNANVMLTWDNEDFLRLLLVVSGEGGASLRTSLWEDDVKMLLDALRQVQAEL